MIETVLVYLIVAAAAGIRDQHGQSCVLAPLDLNSLGRKPTAHESRGLLNSLRPGRIAGNQAFCNQSLVSHTVM